MGTSINYGLGSLKNQFEFYQDTKNKGHHSVQILKQNLNQPDYNKAQKTLTISEVERLINVPRSTIRDKEKSKEIIYTAQSHQADLKKNYSLNDIQQLRSFFKKGFFHGSIKRPKESEPFIMAFSMFKGGVGKTTQATHFAAHCALQGLKTLLIDLDPQASATLIFGYIPAVDIDNGETVHNALVDDFEYINKIIKPTHYDGLDIITSGLELQGSDLILPSSAYNNEEKLGPPLLRLKNALSLVQDKYDVIVLDCAPNHGATTMNALTAANGVILPVSPNMLSYGSSIQFIQTLGDLADSLYTYEMQLDSTSQLNSVFKNISNRLFRILIANDPADKEAQDVTASIRALYQGYVLPRSMIRTIALSRASNDLGLLYDTKRSDVRGSKEAFDRGLASMKAVNEDLLTLLSSIWSQHDE